MEKALRSSDLFGFTKRSVVRASFVCFAGVNTAGAVNTFPPPS